MSNQLFSNSTKYFNMIDDLIPISDNTIDLGSSTQRWKHLHSANATVNTMVVTNHIVDSVILDIANQDCRLYRSSANVIGFDNNSSGNGTLQGSQYNVVDSNFGLKLFGTEPQISLDGDGNRLRYDKSLKELEYRVNGNPNPEIVFGNGLSKQTGQFFITSDGSGSIGSSSCLQLNSTTTGFLPPRMTETQRDANVAPIVGLTIHNITQGNLNQFSQGSWNNIWGYDTNKMSNGTDLTGFVAFYATRNFNQATINFTGFSFNTTVSGTWVSTYPLDTQFIPDSPGFYFTIPYSEAGVAGIAVGYLSDADGKIYIYKDYLGTSFTASSLSFAPITFNYMVKIT